MSNGTPLPPGWYLDGQGRQRWWDGYAWGAAAPTADTAAPTPPPAQPYFQPPPPPGMSPYSVGGSPAGPVPGGPAGDTSMAVLAHVLGIFFPIIGPLVIYLIEKDKSAFSRNQAAEAFNFGITYFIGYVASAVLMFVCIGYVTLLLVFIGSIVLHIVAAVAASKGEWYRYPINLRLIS